MDWTKPDAAMRRTLELSAKKLPKECQEIAIDTSDFDRQIAEQRARVKEARDAVASLNREIDTGQTPDRTAIVVQHAKGWGKLKTIKFRDRAQHGKRGMVAEFEGVTIFAPYDVSKWIRDAKTTSEMLERIASVAIKPGTSCPSPECNAEPPPRPSNAKEL